MRKYALLFLTTFLSLTGCRGSGPSDDGREEKIDKSRTQLYVSNFNGGYGDTWLKSLKTKFEAMKAKWENEKQEV